MNSKIRHSKIPFRKFLFRQAALLRRARPTCLSSTRVWKNRGKVSDQFAEIHPSVGRKEKYDLAVIEGVFHRDKLHFKAVGGNFFVAYGKWLLFPSCGFPQDGRDPLLWQPV